MLTNKQKLEHRKKNIEWCNKYYKRITYLVDEDKREKLKRLAKEKNLSLTKFIDFMVDDYLTNIP